MTIPFAEVPRIPVRLQRGPVSTVSCVSLHASTCQEGTTIATSTHPGEVVVIAAMTAKEDSVTKLESALKSLLAPTQAEEGCLQYELHVDQAEPRRFVFVERWTSLEALDAHRRAPHLLAFREQAGDLLDGPSDVKTLTRVTA